MGANDLIRGFARVLMNDRLGLLPVSVAHSSYWSCIDVTCVPLFGGDVTARLLIIQRLQNLL